jgi:glycosyltransferase involved in cell wall biosynthesis
MKICYIAGYYYASNDGIGRYTHNLIEEIKRLDSSNTIEVVAENTKSSKSSSSGVKTHARKPLLPSFVHRAIKPFVIEKHYFQRYLKAQSQWQQRLRPIEADIYHAISPSEAVAAVHARKKPLVTTFHDIIPLLFKPRYVFEKYYFEQYARLAKRSDAIIADSLSTKQDLIKLLNIPKERITVIYPGIDTARFSPKPKKPGVTKKILFQGGLVRRKGVYETLAAFAKLLEKRKDVLLQIGGGGDESFALKSEVSRLGIQKYVEFLGFVPEKDLPATYYQADLFVYPSQYEGFGYTPLEAMACGTPVLTSNTSSIPEVVESAAVTVDPNNTTAIAKEMDRILSDSALQKRMMMEGPLVAGKFTQQRCAKKTLALYDKLLGR